MRISPVSTKEREEEIPLQLMEKTMVKEGKSMRRKEQQRGTAMD